ncbi:crossover junction endodeoxyribonuclease RuvC [mine drainage metagenome]|uniref:Crossover junction endodeoxyribonuclease RuvC n=1 Tax=mine drainage metagenome TaxID=410659 RepID=A0A1J5Q5X9_9ZZZZ
MRVLGVDPGLTRCGYGLVEGVGQALTLVTVGVIRTAPDSPLDQRLLALETELSAIVQLWKPESIAVERVFSQLNVKTAMGTAQAAGIALLTAARFKIPVAMHTPSEVKAAVTGSGRAEKAQVGQMVTRILRLDSVPKPADSADALALAICQIWRGPALARLSAAISR